MANNTHHSAAEIRIMRSQLGRARGLGSAKTGTGHGTAQRLTAMALLPLTIWFVISLLCLVGGDRDDVAAWAGHPINAALLVLTIITSFYHGMLGVQTVAEDYIHHEGIRTIVIILVKGAVWLVGAATVIAAIKLAM